MKVSTKLSVVCCALFMHAGAAFSADNKYAANAIPSSLLKGADAVTRSYHMELSISSANEIELTETRAITILNERGDRLASIFFADDKFHKTTKVSGTLYDKEGQEVKSMKKKEAKEVDISRNFIDDVHRREFSFGYHIYPYTVEYTVVVRMQTSLRIPSWNPQQVHNCAVENADLEVGYPKDFPLRYRVVHMNEKPLITTVDNENKLSLAIHNIPACASLDEFTPVEDYYYPAVIFASDKLAMGDEEGTMATWKDFGTFFYKLNDGRDGLPDELKKTVHALTDTCKNVQSKINVLYGYLQKNTHYLSIQLGIGGWQTLPAEFVAEKSYGDCKALSNFMKGMLKEAGVTAYAVLAYGGRDEDRRKMMLDFPANEFNHVILCAPVAGDTVWLECTSQSLPAGYLSGFTNDRYVLMLTPSGGIPVKTPTNKAGDNVLARHADIRIDDKDVMEGELKLAYAGYFWEHEHGYVIDQPKADVDHHLNRKMSSGSFVVSKSQIDNNLSGKVPVVNELLKIKGEGSVSRTASRFFVPSTVFYSQMLAPSSSEARDKPFRISESFIVNDTVVYHLPQDYVMEDMIDRKMGKVDAPFATYEHQATLSDRTLTITTSYTQKAGIYDAALFADYIKLYKRLAADAQSKLVLKKKA